MPSAPDKEVRKLRWKMFCPERQQRWRRRWRRRERGRQRRRQRRGRRRRRPASFVNFLKVSRVNLVKSLTEFPRGPATILVSTKQSSFSSRSNSSRLTIPASLNVLQPSDRYTWNEDREPVGWMTTQLVSFLNYARQKDDDCRAKFSE